jgi:hypothetical protein
MPPQICCILWTDVAKIHVLANTQRFCSRFGECGTQGDLPIVVERNKAAVRIKALSVEQMTDTVRVSVIGTGLERPIITA